MQRLSHSSKILEPSKNLFLQIDVLQFFDGGITEHSLKGGIDPQETSLIVGLIDPVRSIFDHGPKTRFRHTQRLHSSFPLRNVAIHDNHLFRHTTRRRDNSRRGFEDSPRSVLVAHSVLQCSTNAREPSFECRVLYPLAIFWMDL